MAVVLQIKTGPLAGKHTTLATGQSLLIGRASDRAQFDGSTHFLSTSLPPNRAIEEYEKSWRSRRKQHN